MFLCFPRSMQSMHSFSCATVFIIKITQRAAGCNARSHQTRRRLPQAPTVTTLSTWRHDLDTSTRQKTSGVRTSHKHSGSRECQEPLRRTILANGGSGGGGGLAGRGASGSARTCAAGCTGPATASGTPPVLRKASKFGPFNLTWNTRGRSCRNLSS